MFDQMKMKNEERVSPRYRSMFWPLLLIVLGGLWLLVLLAVGVTTWLILDTSRQAWMMLTYPVGFFMLLLYLGAASQSSRFFVDARRTMNSSLHAVSIVMDVRMTTKE